MNGFMNVSIKEELKKAIDYHRNKNYLQAIDYYDKSIAEEPSNAELWINKGSAYIGLGNYEEAIKSYKKAIELSADSAIAFFYLSWCYLLIGKEKEALENLKQAVALDETLKLTARENEIFKPLMESGEIGKFSSKNIPKDKKQTSSNTNTQQNTSSSSSNQAEDYFAEGWSFHQKKEYEKAIEKYDKAIELNPYFMAPRSNKSVCLKRLGKVLEAIDICTEMMSITDTYGDAYYNRACYYSILGKTVEAVYDLQKAINIDKKYKYMAKEDEDFDKIKDNQNFINATR